MKLFSIQKKKHIFLQDVSVDSDGNTQFKDGQPYAYFVMYKDPQTGLYLIFPSKVVADEFIGAQSDKDEYRAIDVSFDYCNRPEDFNRSDWLSDIEKMIEDEEFWVVRNSSGGYLTKYWDYTGTLNGTSKYTYDGALSMKEIKDRSSDYSGSHLQKIIKRANYFSRCQNLKKI